MKKILFSFIRCPEKRLAEVNLGTAPKESLLGYHHLRSNSTNVKHLNHLDTVSEESKLKRIIGNINSFIWSDIIIFATQLRFFGPLICRLSGKSVVFYDAFQILPNHFLRKLYYRLCIGISNRCIFYSRNQLKLWQIQYPGLKTKGHNIPYGIDSGFYSTDEKVKLKPTSARQQYVSIGRDPSRDFITLANAFTESSYRLILITQDYMLNEKLKQCHNVKIKTELSYAELSELYDDSKASIIPILADTSHLSGIRAAMEAMAKHVPVLITYNDSLAEYFEERQHVLYFKAEKTESLHETIALLESTEIAQELTQNAHKLITTQYTYQKMCNELLDAIDA